MHSASRFVTSSLKRCSGIISETSRQSFSSSSVEDKKRRTFVNIIRDARSAEAQRSLKNVPQRFTNFLIVDFEATCNNMGPKPDPQEIIEFPVLNLCSKTFEEVSRFHSYVQPDVHKQLSDFCIELTGIVQSSLDEQPNLKQVLDKFDNWLQEFHLNEENTLTITYGDWDIKQALNLQCAHLGIPVPRIFHQWANLKDALNKYTGKWPRSLTHSVDELGLTFIGRHHSGIDDCRNIAQMVSYLGSRGFVFRPTKFLRE